MKCLKGLCLSESETECCMSSYDLGLLGDGAIFIKTAALDSHPYYMRRGAELLL